MTCKLTSTTRKILFWKLKKKDKNFRLGYVQEHQTDQSFLKYILHL